MVCAKQYAALDGWGGFHYDRIGTVPKLGGSHHKLGVGDDCDETIKEELKELN